MPPSEPTPADVAAVASAIGQPAPAPQPEPAPAPQMQPEPPTPQPAPSQQPAGDPFESLFTPTQQPASPPPTEPPASPAPEPQAPPVEPAAAPQQPPAPAEPPAYQTYDEYIKGVLKDVPETPASPDPSNISPDDPQAIKSFFDELVNTAVTKAEAATTRRQAIQASERRLWDASFEKYGSLRTNKQLRDMVHSIRMGHFQRGEAITPTQAADKLLDAMKSQYQKGVADNQVVTTIENAQPQGGGSGTPVPTTLDKQNVLTAVQTGGETALAEILDAEIKAGRL